MRTENKNSEKDLNANPDSSLNTNRPLAGGRFPESQQARDEMKKIDRQDRMEGRRKDDDIEELADDVKGTVGSRETRSDPEDIAGVSDLDQGMRRARRKH